MPSMIVPPGEGLAFRLPEGKRVRLSTPKGRQCADFFAFRDGNMSEWLSPLHSWMPTRSLHPRVGDIMQSRLRAPMIEMVEDGADGVHDFLIAPCDPIRYAQFGVPEHRSCVGNLVEAMGRLGIEVPISPPAVNFFATTTVTDGFMFNTPASPVAKPGAYVVLKAHMNLVCAVSSCPYDLVGPGWNINDPAGSTEILIDLD